MADVSFRDYQVMSKTLPKSQSAFAGLFAGFAPETLPAIPGIEGLGQMAQPCTEFNIGQRVVSTAWPLKTGQGCPFGLRSFNSSSTDLEWLEME